ncbi:MAG: 2-dehydropantoate 2-reductase [Phycisphaerales bacterium]|jgi:2-dehydropantoate 2-reductase
MRVLIYGGGAVGLGLASCLLKSKAGVDIIARKDTVASLQKAGLTRTGLFGNYHASPQSFGSFSSLNNLEEKAYDYILVCTKSFDSLNSAKDLSQHKSLFGEKTKIVLFQNGWGNAEIFTSFFEKEIIYNGRVITGFRRKRKNEVDITVHADSIHIGSLFGSPLSNVEDLSESINNGDIPCITTADIEKDIWAKMLYNCALNPLGAILGVPYGELAEHKSTRTLMNSIIDEAFNVMTKSGHKTHWPTAEDFLNVFYEKLVPDTAEHKSSTLQDINAKKRTEIDALNGAVIELAGKIKINVPYNLAIFNIVKFIENMNL